MTEEIKARGICLRTTEYGENDRIMTLLTDSKGKIAVRARGVGSPKSKLRHAAVPFAFGEYILTVRGGYYALKTFDYLDSFEAVSYDIIRYYCGAAALETMDKLNEDEVPDVDGFARLLRFLSDICYGGGDVRDFVTFVLDVLRLSGYGLSLGAYREGNDPAYYAFDLEEGGFVSRDVKSGSIARLTTGAARLLIDYVEGVRPQEIPAGSCLAEILSLLSMYVRTKTGYTIRSYFELADMLKGGFASR